MEKTRVYESLFIIDPDKESALEDVQNEIKAIITGNSGEIKEESSIGKKVLAYLVNKKKEGIYYGVKFKALPSAIAKITRLSGINTNIMRTIIDRV